MTLIEVDRFNHAINATDRPVNHMVAPRTRPTVAERTTSDMEGLVTKAVELALQKRDMAQNNTPPRSFNNDRPFPNAPFQNSNFQNRPFKAEIFET